MVGPGRQSSPRWRWPSIDHVGFLGGLAPNGSGVITIFTNSAVELLSRDEPAYWSAVSSHATHEPVHKRTSMIREQPVSHKVIPKPPHKFLAEKAENVESTFSMAQRPCTPRDLRIALDTVGGMERMG